ARNHVAGRIHRVRFTVVDFRQRIHSLWVQGNREIRPLLWMRLFLPGWLLLRTDTLLRTGWTHPVVRVLVEEDLVTFDADRARRGQIHLSRHNIARLDVTAFMDKAAALVTDTHVLPAAGPVGASGSIEDILPRISISRLGRGAAIYAVTVAPVGIARA